MLIKINAYMHLKKHIRMNKFADLDMSIFYFKRRHLLLWIYLTRKFILMKADWSGCVSKSNWNCPINGFGVNICHPKIGSDLLLTIKIMGW